LETETIPQKYKRNATNMIENSLSVFQQNELMQLTYEEQYKDRRMNKPRSRALMT